MKIKTVLSKNHSQKEQSAQTRHAKWDLHLYVAGETPKAVTAFNNLKIICEDRLKANYSIKIIDLLKYPNIAREDQIYATPTLVRKLPLPERNIIGDLSDRERVLAGLDLKKY